MANAFQHPNTDTHTHILTHTGGHTHTHTHTPNTHTKTNSPSHTITQTYTHTLILSFSHTHTNIPTHTHTHTHTLSLSHTHTHTLKTHRHTFSPSPHPILPCLCGALKNSRNHSMPHTCEVVAATVYVLVRLHFSQVMAPSDRRGPKRPLEEMSQPIRGFLVPCLPLPPCIIHEQVWSCSLKAPGCRWSSEICGIVHGLL